jgi:hypothetical protein
MVPPNTTRTIVTEKIVRITMAEELSLICLEEYPNAIVDDFCFGGSLFVFVRKSHTMKPLEVPAACEIKLSSTRLSIFEMHT